MPHGTARSRVRRVQCTAPSSAHGAGCPVGPAQRGRNREQESTDRGQFRALTCATGCTFDTSGCFAVRFVDNGDGTVTDKQTGLMWEKKDGVDGVPNYSDPHDVDNTYSWSAPSLTGGSLPDGGVFTDFLAKLNNCVSSNGFTMSGGFAGHCDWRIPQIDELRTLINCSYPTCLDPILGPTATSGFTFHWSATTDANQPLGAWGVNFNDNGFTSPALAKANAFIRVRAVRYAQ